MENEETTFEIEEVEEPQSALKQGCQASTETIVDDD